ncbi:MAG: hypothetical protein KatS3mg083_111 [Candidatus Dojkabacteria bacterium]|nr:MAG: hypothetical protein KatS3mg083_111 [Candidatus Dojkabacteria bacterium]
MRYVVELLVALILALLFVMTLKTCEYDILNCSSKETIQRDTIYRYLVKTDTFIKSTTKRKYMRDTILKYINDTIYIKEDTLEVAQSSIITKKSDTVYIEYIKAYDLFRYHIAYSPDLEIVQTKIINKTPILTFGIGAGLSYDIPNKIIIPTVGVYTLLPLYSIY